MSKRFYRLPEERDSVPRDVGGIYQFRVRFPSNFELGLVDDKSDVSTAIANLQDFLERVSPTFQLPTLDGALRSSGIAKHLRQHFLVRAEAQNRKPPSSFLEHIYPKNEYTLGAAMSVIDVIRDAFTMAPPLYIGIAAEQSLGMRLDQHLANTTQLSERIKSVGLSWSMIEYQCIPIHDLTTIDMRKLEMLLQSIFKPKLSIR